MRTPLLPGTRLSFGNGQEIIIDELIGQGGSCLVYNAAYCDSRKATHYVRVKECCPFDLALEREKDGSLCVLYGKEAQLEEAKERFRQAYDRNVELQKMQGLVNSTGIANELFEANHTVYSVLSFVEGTDYGRDSDETLREVVEHVLAVAKVLQKYHERGYLHLDIKPENILVIPETAQHIQLFDFDSVVTTEELRKDGYRFSVSDGFAAPEQAQGRMDKIGPATDIYSLGAVLFYKVFGRKAELKDGTLDATIDCSKMVVKEGCELYPVRVAKGLQEFFRKTIAVSPLLRWKEMKQLVSHLEALLANMKKLKVKTNFSYASQRFVGRRKQLDEMEAALMDNDVIVLSGIGGIGKTELAKKYAQLHKDEIEENNGRVFFVRYTKSIRETICGNDIVIVNEELSTEIDEAELFEARMRTLREELTKEDLFILDNFDVKTDRDLGTLLAVGCKFIFTSRCDLSGGNFKSIPVKCLETEEEIYELFEACNSGFGAYNEEERQALSEIFQLVDYHTMTLELLAKFLKETGEKPTQLLEVLKKKSGLSGLVDDEVEQYKDGAFSVESVNVHLLALFDLSGFSEAEEEIMRSLSLLGEVRSLRSTFLDFCKVEQNRKSLSRLIRTGWVQLDEDSDKVSLHQVILDLVYNQMKPTDENCPHLVDAMCTWLEKEAENYVEGFIRYRMLDRVLQRLEGKTLRFAKLVVLYGKECGGGLDNESIRLDLAEQICLSCDEPEAKLLRYEINVRRLAGIFFFDWDSEWDNEAKKEFYLNDVQKILGYTEAAYRDVHSVTMDEGTLANRLMELARKLADIVMYSFCPYDIAKEFDDALKPIYDKVAMLYDEICELVCKAKMSAHEKIEILREMRGFYGLEFGMRTVYCRIDMEKVIRYQKLMYDMKPEGTWDDDIDTGFEMMLEDAYAREEYDMALTGYELLLLRAGKCNSSMKYMIANIYRKKGNYQKAVGILEEVIEEEKRKEFCFFEAYVTLINLLRQMEKKEAAREYANELVEYSLKALQETDDAPDMSYIVFGYHQLYVLEENPVEKESIWQKCMEYFDSLDNDETLNWILHFFLVSYADRECNDEETVRVVLKYADCMAWTDRNGLYAVNQLLNYAQEICTRGEVAPKEKIAVLLMNAKYLQKKSEPEKAIECCETAMNLLGEKCTEDAYLKSKIYQRLRDIYAEYQMGSEDYLNTLRSRCNYYLIAERESRGKTTEEQCDLWANAAFEYSMLGDVEKETACWKHFAELIGCLEEFNEKSYRVYRSESYGFWDNYVKQTEPEKTKALVSGVYSKLLLFAQREIIEEVELGLEYELWEMAHVLGDPDVLVEEAIVLSMLSVYVVVVTEPDWKVMLSVADNMMEVPEKVLGTIREAMQGTLTPEQINRIMRCVDLVDELLKKKEGFDEVREIVELYAKRFSKKEWEFKGEK